MIAIIVTCPRRRITLIGLYCTYIQIVYHTCDQVARAGAARARRAPGRAPHNVQHTPPPTIGTFDHPIVSKLMASSVTTNPMVVTTDIEAETRSPPPPASVDDVVKFAVPLPPVPPPASVDDVFKFAVPLPAISEVGTVDDVVKCAVPLPAISEVGTVQTVPQLPAAAAAAAPADVPCDDVTKIFPEESSSGPDWLVKPNEDVLSLSPAKVNETDAYDVLALGSFALDENEEDISLGDLVDVDEGDDGVIVAESVMSEPVGASGEMEEMESACVFPATGIDTLMHDIAAENKAAAKGIVEECKRKLKALQGGRMGVTKTISKTRGVSCDANYIQGVRGAPPWKALVDDYPVVGELLGSYLQVPNVKFNPTNHQYRGGMKKVLQKVSMGCSSMEELAIATAQYEREENQLIATGEKTRECHALPILRKGIGQKLGEGWVTRKGRIWTQMKSPEELPQ
jgi:hypothetical protein